MEHLITIISRLQKATTFFKNIEGVTPAELAGSRTNLASIILELSLLYPDAKKEMLAIKTKKHKAYLAYREEGESAKDSEMKANVLYEQEAIDAEYMHDQIRFAIDGATEIANALATEIKTLELKTKNLI